MNSTFTLLYIGLILACYPCEACGEPVGDSVYVDFENEPEYAYCNACCNW